MEGKNKNNFIIIILLLLPKGGEGVALQDKSMRGYADFLLFTVEFAKLTLTQLRRHVTRLLGKFQNDFR